MLLAFAQTDFTCNPFETGIAVEHLNLVLIGNGLDKFGSHNGLYDKVRRLHLAGCDTVLDNIVQEEQASLVTVNQHPFALVVLASHTYAVGIRVACHHDVGVYLLGKFNCHGKRFRVFGIRRNHCREITALHHLFGHAVYILKAPFFQRSGNERSARAVKRSINDAEVFLTLDYFRVDRKGMNLVQIYLVYIFTDNLNQIFVAFELDILNGYLVYFIDNGCVVRSKYLCTVIPISLVAVVFFRVVACSQIDTALATEVADSEGNFRSRTQILEEINLDTVCRENIGRDFGELAAVVTAVVTHHNRDLPFVLEAFVQIVCQSLGSRTYRIDIHAVAACTHDAAQTARSEFQVFIKALYQFGFIWIFQHSFHFSLSFGIVCRGKPFFGFLSHLFNQLLIFHKTFFILKVNTSFSVLSQM